MRCPVPRAWTRSTPGPSRSARAAIRSPASGSQLSRAQGTPVVRGLRPLQRHRRRVAISGAGLGLSVSGPGRRGAVCHRGRPGGASHERRDDLPERAPDEPAAGERRVPDHLTGTFTATAAADREGRENSFGINGGNATVTYPGAISDDRHSVRVGRGHDRWDEDLQRRHHDDSASAGASHSRRTPARRSSSRAA